MSMPLSFQDELRVLEVSEMEMKIGLYCLSLSALQCVVLLGREHGQPDPSKRRPPLTSAKVGLTRCSNIQLLYVANNGGVSYCIVFTGWCDGPAANRGACKLAPFPSIQGRPAVSE